MTKNSKIYPHNLFPFLVKHYYHHIWLGRDRNDGILGNAHFIKSKTIDGGKIYYYNDPHTGPDEPIKMGKELPDISLRIISMTRTELERIKRKELIRPDAKEISTRTEEEFYEALKAYTGEDGAIAFIRDDGKNHSMLSIGKVKVDNRSFSKKIYVENKVLPKDYWPPTEKNPLITTTSTGKSMLLKTSDAFGNSYGISSTVLTPIGTGLIMHFRNGLLFESYLLDRITGYQKGHNRYAEAIGTYRLYLDERGKNYTDSDGHIIPVFEIDVDHNLLTPTEKSVYDISRK